MDTAGMVPSVLMARNASEKCSRAPMSMKWKVKEAPFSFRQNSGLPELAFGSQV
jgi:hypothetical protein